MFNKNKSLEPRCVFIVHELVELWCYQSQSGYRGVGQPSLETSALSLRGAALGWLSCQLVRDHAGEGGVLRFNDPGVVGYAGPWSSRGKTSFAILAMADRSFLATGPGRGLGGGGDRQGADRTFYSPSSMQCA